MNRLVAATLVLALAGCATGPNANPKDPLEPFNRKMFAFNDTLDTYAIKPLAQGYQKVVPSPVRTGVHNFFGNFSDAWSTVNQFLQGKFDNTGRMAVRVATNTIVGLGGLFDVATRIGLDRRAEDLGQTFGAWGLPPGPYLVLPLFGPSDVRDAVALPADDYVTPALLVDTWGQKIAVDALGVIDARANLLAATNLLDDIALDRYTFLRDAYLTRRRSLVYDGNPPDDPSKSDDDDDPRLAPAPGNGASAAAQPGVPPSSPQPPIPAPVPGPGVTPAPLPASAPPLPVPLPGPAPVPPPPASSPG